MDVLPNSRERTNTGLAVVAIFRCGNGWRFYTKVGLVLCIILCGWGIVIFINWLDECLHFLLIHISPVGIR